MPAGLLEALKAFSTPRQPCSRGRLFACSCSHIFNYCNVMGCAGARWWEIGTPQGAEANAGVFCRSAYKRSHCDGMCRCACLCPLSALVSSQTLWGDGLRRAVRTPRRNAGSDAKRLSFRRRAPSGTGRCERQVSCGNRLHVKGCSMLIIVGGYGGQ